MQQKLSQILFYVEKSLYKEDIWAFRTKNVEKFKKIRFTYLEYYPLENENRIEGAFDCVESQLISKNDEVIIISDDADVIKESLLRKIPVVELISEDSKVFSAADYCIYEISEMSFDTLYKIWQRQVGIPWEIARTKRLLIREQTIEDLTSIYKMYLDPSTTLYMEDIEKDIDKEKKYLEDYISHQYKFYEYGLWTLLDIKSGDYVGRAGLSIREGFEKVEIGYVITPEYRNKRLAYEACKAIINYAKENLNIESLVAYTVENNQYSIKLLKSLGFERCQKANIKGRVYDTYRILL